MMHHLNSAFPCWQCQIPCQTLFCEACQSYFPWYQEPPTEDIHAIFHYRPPIDQLITQFKFQHQLYLGRFFSGLLIQRLQIDKPEQLIPVPLHKKRLQERGFNQCLEIIKPIAKQLDLPINLKSLVKNKATAAQMTLNATTRRRNLKRAFSLTSPPDAQHVALIDDVYTTGTTTHHLRDLLLEAGVARVSIWVIAKT